MTESTVFNNRPEQFWGEVANTRLESTAFLGNLENLLMQREQADLSLLSAADQYRLLTRRAYTEFPEATPEHPSELFQRLTEAKQTGNRLVVKYGIDPTGGDIHWGHTLALRTAMKLLRMGNDVHFIIGGFTAMVGDGTDRNAPRQALSQGQVEENSHTYNQQIEPFIPYGEHVGEIFHYNNAEWLRDRPMDKLTELRLLQYVNATDLLKRYDFQERIAKHKPVSMAELMYAIYTGIDSVRIGERGADIEVCGQDQLMNTLVARTVQEFFEQRPEAILASHLIPGIDGRGKKMSKSLNNYIPVNATPEDMFARIMSMADDYTPLENSQDKQPKPIRWGLMRMYLEQFTEIDDMEWVEIQKRLNKGTMDPLDVKRLIARRMVGTIYGPEVAFESQQVFDQGFAQLQNKREAFLRKIDEAGVTGELSDLSFNSLLSLGAGQRKLMENSKVRFVNMDGQTVAVVMGRNRIMVANPDTRTDKRKQIPLTDAEFKQWLAESGIDPNALLLQNGEFYFGVNIQPGTGEV
jgi:tyrosyl-tRNA synthetase